MDGTIEVPQRKIVLSEILVHQAQIYVRYVPACTYVDRLLELVDMGAANTAPLVLSAFWLARNRESLRGSD